MPSKSSENGLREKEVRALQARLSHRGRSRARIRRWVRVVAWVVLVQGASGAKRFLDLLLAVILIVVLSPLLFAGGLAALAGSGKVFECDVRIGRFMTPFRLFRFARFAETFPAPLTEALGLRRLPVLWNIVRGEMSFVGPRPAKPDELDATQRAARKRTGERPGLVCLWWLRRQGNVDYGAEWEADGEYVDHRSLAGDLGIALRAAPALLLGGHVTTAPPEIHLLRLRIDNMLMEETVGRLMQNMSAKRKTRVCFVNADCANIAWRNSEYHACLRSADLVLADGIGMRLAGKALRREVRQNVNGTDLFPELLREMARERRSVFLLGARPTVVEGVVEYVQANFPDVTVAGYHHGYYEPHEEDAVVRSIQAAHPDCLLVAFGAPRQDLWAGAHHAETGATVAMGVGGLFDFYSGRIPRAPQWMREIGMEWFYRFIQEPRRMWRRYFVGNVVFLWRVLREVLAGETTESREVL